ncbi:protein involved in colanic acid production [Escherichia coli]|uniref:Protein involved in colanic acid production n=1 Tax=Escherichia coli TaxID=562 RepID=A0A377KAA2_ECOLX|nr:protein involved in colanic acid production [Escherichia coli]
MKKCLTLLIATVLSGISLTAYAAQPMSNLDSGQLRPAGTVSATGASNLSDLEDKLAEKAREQGAKGYVIIPQAEMTRCSVLQSSTNNPTNVTAFASGCSFRPICKQKTSNMNVM